MMLDRLDYATRAHRMMLNEQPPLPCGLTPEGIYADQAALAKYTDFAKSDREFAAGMWRLRAAESAMAGQLQQAGRSCSAAVEGQADREKLQKLSSAVRALVSERRDERAILFPEETQRISSAIRRQRIPALAARLGQTADVKALSVAEMIALEHGSHLYDLGQDLTTIENQLARIPPDRPLQLAMIVGDTRGLGIQSRVVKPEEIVVVATLGPGIEFTTLAGHFQTTKVLPVNRAAVALFGGVDERTVINIVLTQFDQTLRPELNTCIPK
jgi:hypothetical protein